MTKPTTEELKDLLSKVTQGKWKWHDHDDCNDGNVTAGRLQADEPVIWHCECVSLSDATLIALAPSLAAEVVRLREALDQIDRVVSECEYDKKTRHTINRLRQALDATSEK